MSESSGDDDKTVNRDSTTRYFYATDVSLGTSRRRYADSYQKSATLGLVAETGVSKRGCEGMEIHRMYTMPANDWARNRRRRRTVIALRTQPTCSHLTIGHFVESFVAKEKTRSRSVVELTAYFVSTTSHVYYSVSTGAAWTRSRRREKVLGFSIPFPSTSSDIVPWILYCVKGNSVTVKQYFKFFNGSVSYRTLYSACLLGKTIWYIVNLMPCNVCKHNSVVKGTRRKLDALMINYFMK